MLYIYPLQSIMKANYIPYINQNDYLIQIRSDQLNNQLLDEITKGGDFERKKSEAFAIDEVRYILGSYFYLDFEFRDLLPFNYNRKYHAGDRCIIDFPYWIGNTSQNVDNEDGGNGEGQISYNVGDCVVYNGGQGYVGGVYQESYNCDSQWIGYCCTKENSDINFTLSNWIAIGNQYDIYFVNFPYPIFQLVPDKQIGTEVNGLYFSELSRVCWENRIYKCISNSIILTHHEQEQYGRIGSVPHPNIFPNQKTGNYLITENSGFYGNKQWCDEGEFYFLNILPSYPNYNVQLNSPWCDENGYCWNGNTGCLINPNSEQYIKTWVLGDNRSQTMIEIIVAIAVHNLLGRNSFMLKERAIKKDWAYAKLQKIKDGDNTTLIPIIQPEQAGGGVSFGGDVKKINQWR